MFEHMTPELLRNRILDRLTTDLQTREGSFTNDVIAAAAVELSECYHSLDALLPAFYVDETSGPYIDRQAGIIGIVRKQGTRASCLVIFGGSSGAVVPAGAVYYTASGLAFYLEDAVHIQEGTGEGTLLAAETGSQYNIAAGEITSALRNYTGITSFDSGPAEGGTDPETDEALLDRYLERMRRPPTSGNPWHYQMWALETEGIGAARIISKWDGPGTVKVILADQELRPASNLAVEACAAHIQQERPVGPAVTVEAARVLEIILEAEAVLDGSVSPGSVHTALETAARAYFYDIASTAFRGCLDLQFDSLEDGNYQILYNRLAYLLLSIPGVTDYRTLTINGTTENLTVPADTLPILREVKVR